MLEDVWIYGHLDSHGSENAIGASEATAGRLIWSVTRFLSDRDGTVIEAVAAEVEDEDFGARERVPLDLLLDTRPHLLVVDVLV